MVLCGAGSVGSPVKGDPTYKRWMIAVHVGLMLNALYIVVFGIQFARSRGLPEKADRNFLFMLMTCAAASAGRPALFPTARVPAQVWVRHVVVYARQIEAEEEERVSCYV